MPSRARMSILVARSLRATKNWTTLNHEASRKLIERMAQDPDQLRGYLNLIFVGRCLETRGRPRYQYCRRRSLRRGCPRYSASIPHCHDVRDHWQTQLVLPNFPSSGCLSYTGSPRVAWGLWPAAAGATQALLLGHPFNNDPKMPTAAEKTSVAQEPPAPASWSRRIVLKKCVFRIPKTLSTAN
jgi:hypothetical protein